MVIDSEFIQLDDLEAYLRLPGDWPVAKVKFEIKEEQNRDNSAVFPVGVQAKNIELVADLQAFQSLDEAEKPAKRGIRANRVKVEEAKHNKLKN